MLTGIDHLVVVVPDLAEAVRHYAGQGFTVVPGGRHPGGSHNALIGLADGAYIELLAFEHPSPGHRWWAISERTRREGPCLADFAMATNDLERDLGVLRAAGVPMGEPRPGSRARPDGYTVEWRLSTPPTEHTGVAPFLIQDITPRMERVPAELGHHNGVIGIDTLTIAADDLTWVRRWYVGVLSEAVRRRIAGRVTDASLLHLGIGRHVLQYERPESPSDPLNAWLHARGPSRAGATLRTNDGRTHRLSAAGSLEM